MNPSIVSDEQTSKKCVYKVRDVQQRAEEWVSAWKTEISEALFVVFSWERVKLDHSSGTECCTGDLLR